MKNDEIWALYAKSVKKLRKEKSPSPSFPRPVLRSLGVGGTRELASEYIPLPFAGMTEKDEIKPLKLERRKEKELREGDIDIEARIDLHGMTQEVAFESLARFMAAQNKSGRRHLLVITGKGRGKEGVLRTNLPHWLQTLPEARQILAVRPAAPKHGGDGAFYIILRKKKAGA